ncbi:MAG: ribosome silencing factor [Candidatus Omnitrophica bacterium]|nr:ribosome silencing factor [Candidatus Omnitrophota bacterium]
MRKKVLKSERLAQKVARFADDTKAQDIVILDMRELVNFCDFFVIATGTSDRQARAIAEGIQEGLKEEGLEINFSRSLKSLGGLQYSQENGAWILLDMGDVVAHIFEPQAREFYALEHLWQDAAKIEYKTRGKKK